MKYLVVLGDGMADVPVPELGNKTPLEAAYKPYMDEIAKNAEQGLVKTVPDGMAPGSDNTNLSIMGYDPEKYYTGRSPLEAVSMGINMSLSDIAVRCNLVTLSENNEKEYEDKIMLDYSSDEISTEEAAELIKYVEDNMGDSEFKFYPGISYRHCMIWNNGKLDLECSKPHDITNKCIREHMPAGNDNDKIASLMRRSYQLLKDHPVNIARRKRGLKPANSIWLWGEGSKPNLSAFKDMYGLRGAVISAVDLIKGIGICAGMKIINVKGATGTINTNFEGKADACIKEFKEGADFIYLHVEAADECGHHREIENKVRSIELIDEKLVGPVKKYLDSCGDEYSMLIMPDHPTPLHLGTHTASPVPYLLYRSNKSCPVSRITYSEKEAEASGIFIDAGYKLTQKFIGCK